jgi:hypothetical protein
MMHRQDVTEQSKAIGSVRSRAIEVIGLAAATVLCLGAGSAVFAATPPPAPDQLLVTAANSDGSAILDLNMSPSSPNPPFTPKITNTTTLLNSDAHNHGSFDALVWVSNPYCKTLDLIVADAAKGQIVRYQGPTTQSLPNCYTTTGAPVVNGAAQPIFTWVKPKPGQPSPGPAQPNALSVDAYGNLFVVSSSGLFDSKPSVWVLPFNPANGTYGSPLLIDNRFGGVLTLALAETLIAPTQTALWKAGDLLVLVGDSFDARLTVYSKSAIYANATTGAINPATKLNLTGPSSVAIPFLKFLGVLAAPFGMDIWPANTSLGPNTSVLFTTIDGRILRFDTVQDKFVANFATGLGLGLQKLKVGTYDNVPYAFVAQLQARNTGQVLAFAAPLPSGVNRPLAAVTSGFMNPRGLAVAQSGSTPVPTGCTSCSVAPLGPVATTFFTPPSGASFSGSITEQICIVDPDPRTSATISNGVLASWSCTAMGSPAPILPIGSGTSYCPTFPAATIPGSVCGHSGPDARALAVIEGTALGVDPQDNNTFFATPLNTDAVLPGPGNLECSQFMNGGVNQGRIPLTAWGTREDLTTVEGTIPEDSLLGFPNLGGANGYLAESTTACDASTTGGHGISMFAFGVGLSDNSPAYVYALQNEKSASLYQTVEFGNISGADSNGIPVQTQLENDIKTINRYVSAAQTTTPGAPSPQTNDINCALNEIYATDSYLRTILLTSPQDFNSSLNKMTGGGDTDPAGAIDSGLANWYLTLSTEILLNAPPTFPSPPYSYPLPFPVSAGPLCQGQPQLYSVTASVTGLTGTGLQLQDSFNNSALSLTATDPVVPANSNGNYTFQTVLASGTSYNVTIPVQPSGQTCAVGNNGTGVIGSGNVTVSVSCTATVSGTPVINSFTLVFPGDDKYPPGYGTTEWVFADIIASNYVQCNMGALYGNGGGPSSPNYYEIPSPDNEFELGETYSNSSSLYPPAGAPGYGTDTYVLTCYGAAGTTPATMYLLNHSGMVPVIPEDSPSLAIDGFQQDINGNLNWITQPIENSATCTIFDEFGGTLPSTITPSTYAIQPAISVPTSGSGYVLSNENSCAIELATPQLIPDTLTLVCSDEYLGTAVAQTVWSGGKCTPPTIP